MRRDRNGKPGATRGRKATGLVREGDASQPGFRKDEIMTFWDGSRWTSSTGTPASPGRRRSLLGAAAEGALITALIFGLVVGTTLAAKGGGRGPRASATVTVADGVYATSHPAVVSPAGLWVRAMCYQDGSWVYGQYVQTDADGVGNLQLGPTSWWQGGPAECTAEAGAWSRKNGSWVTRGETTFSVAAP
jgi:hypothetical protein